MLVRKKLAIGIGLTISLLGISACSDDAEEGADDAAESAEETPSSDDSSAESDAESNQAAPEPDLEGIPDVVAVVNDEEIARDEFVSSYEAQFQQMAMQAQMSGEEVDQEQLKSQVVESMVDTELLVQEATDRGFEASDDEVDSTLEDLASQNGMESSDDFLSTLEEQGWTEDEVMSQLETQIKVEALISDEAGEIEPSEDELRELYEQFESQQGGSGEEGGEVPSFEDMRPQLEEQVRAQEENQVVQALVGDLREDADVTINL